MYDEIDETLNKHMELVMNLASLGRAARAKAGIKVRQPLPKAIIVVPDEAESVAALRPSPNTFRTNSTSRRWKSSLRTGGFRGDMCRRR